MMGPVMLMGMHQGRILHKPVGPVDCKIDDNIEQKQDGGHFQDKMSLPFARGAIPMFAAAMVAIHLVAIPCQPPAKQQNKA